MTYLPRRKELTLPQIVNRSTRIPQITHTRPLAMKRMTGAMGVKKAIPLFPT